MTKIIKKCPTILLWVMGLLVIFTMVVMFLVAVGAVLLKGR